MSTPQQQLQRISNVLYPIMHLQDHLDPLHLSHNHHKTLMVIFPLRQVNGIHSPDSMHDPLHSNNNNIGEDHHHNIR
jgi:hypothetical protein